MFIAPAPQALYKRIARAVSETAIKRAIGAAIFAAILVAVTPILFDGSGDALTRDPPVISDKFGKPNEDLQTLSRQANHNREKLTSEMQGNVRRDEQGNAVNEVNLPAPVAAKPDKQKHQQADTASSSSTLASGSSPTIGELIDKDTPTSATSQNTVTATAQSNDTQKTAALTSPDDEDWLGKFITNNGFSGWVVQAGLFAQPVNAARVRALVARVLENDQVFVRKHTVGESTYDAVFVGPYADKSKAQEVQEKISKELDIKSYVRNLKSL